MRSSRGVRAPAVLLAALAVLAGLAAVRVAAPSRVDAARLDLDEPVALRVLAIRSNGPGVALVDLEAGTVARHGPGRHALGRDAVDGAVLTPVRGEAIVWSDGVARLFREDPGQVERVLRPDPLRRLQGVAPSLRVVPTLDGEAAWLVQPGHEFGGETLPTLVQLVELASGRELFATELGSGAFPVAATASGLVLHSDRLVDSGEGWVTEPGSERVLHLDTAGEVRDIGPGRALGAGASEVVRLECPPERPAAPGRCELRASGVDGGGDRRLQSPGAGHWVSVSGPAVPGDLMPLGAVSPDGSQVLVGLTVETDGHGEAARTVLLAVDLRRGTAAEIATVDGPVPLATWSRDGRWVALVEGRDVRVVPADDPAAPGQRLRDVIPAEHFVFAAG